jgi:translation initiation factor 2 subunit 3
MVKKLVEEKLIPQCNIGMVGHVAHGKTIVVEALTGKLTLMHSEELKRGITIRLGYADATFYKCKNDHYFSVSEKCPYCFEKGEILRTVSFIDLPGHETLMATVLTGASLMDGAILVIAANEKCPQPQTREHLMALEAVGIKNVIVVQNKIDLVTKERALESYEEIKRFLEGTIIEDAPIIPVSAQQRININALIQAIEEKIPTPKREKDKDPYMLVARSFDINRPGTRPKDLKGGVLGGALIEGRFKLDDEIEVRPGLLTNGGHKILNSKILGLQKAGISLKEAGPGGLIGMMTELDPSLTKSDYLVGNVVGLPDKLPEVQNEISIKFKLLERVIGTKELAKVEPIKKGESLLVNVGTARSLGAVKNVSKDVLEMDLKIPICARKDERIVISRQISGRWRLIGWGKLL